MRAVNPYEKPSTAAEIVAVLKSYDLKEIVKKVFYDRPDSDGTPEATADERTDKR
jgi:hypothetical protein